MDSWEHLADWWVGEVASDTAYHDDVLPLFREVFDAPDGTVLDLGCGEGRIMREIGDRAVGCDLSATLLARASSAGPAVRGRLPILDWVKPGACAGAVAVMVIEHVAALDTLFREVARVVGGGGTLAVVMNHPAYTAPSSGPIIDQTDGEVLWRWGPYFSASTTEEPAGTSTVTFHHRPLGRVLTMAAAQGWALEVMEERPLGPATVAQHPGLAGQEHFPRLLGVRWRRLMSVEAPRM